MRILCNLLALRCSHYLYSEIRSALFLGRVQHAWEEGYCFASCSASGEWELNTNSNLFSSLCKRLDLAIISTNQNQIRENLTNDTINNRSAPWVLEPAQLSACSFKTQQTTMAFAKICLQKLSLCPALDM